MKHRGRKVAISVFAIVLLVLVGVGIYLYNNVPITMGGKEPKKLEELPKNQILTKNEINADRKKMIRCLEDIHPSFLLGSDQSAYDQAKEDYLSKTETEMSVLDFRIATSEFVNSFQDGHTRMTWEEKQYLDIQWKYEEDELHLMKDNISLTSYVTSIGGVKIEEIFALIDKIRPAENPMAVARNYTDYTGGRNLLEAAGVKVDQNEVEVSFSDGTSQAYSWKEKSEIVTEEVNTCYMKDDIFVIDFNECVDDENLKSIASQLEKAVEQGTTKVIIDARRNGGGNSNACTRLLEAMDMKVPDYTMFIRYSKEAKHQVGYLRSSGSYESKGTFKGQANPAIHLVVLCDRYTFSSATMLLVFVRDGGLGTIIGEPSSNMPSCYGDCIYYSLDHSHLSGTISHKRFIRPDRQNEERMLIPDISTASEDAMDKAEEFLN